MGVDTFLQNFFRWLFSLFILVLVVGAPIGASAANINACWDASTVTSDMATVQLIADTSGVVAADVLAGSTIAAGRQCKVVPFPLTLTRGVDHAMTLRAVNAFGDVGGASTPVTFHPPNIPGVVGGVTIQAVVP